MSTLNVDKVDPSTGTALEIGTSGDTITVPSGATFVVAGTTEITGTNNVQRPNANPLIINGDMAVAQRATSVTGGSTGYHTCDRWRWVQGTFDAVVDFAHETLTSGDAYADGFQKAYKYDVTTADITMAAAHYSIIQYKWEGQDIQCIKKGTANAQPVTLSFWVKSTKTGTFVSGLYDVDNTRNCSQAYTISSTNTWEYKVVNFPADTTGVMDSNNSNSLNLNFYTSAGSDRTSGTLATTWESYVAANVAVGQVNGVDSTSNTFHITGVQMEVGEYTSSTIPPFQHESYGDNLLRCMRYYNIFGNAANKPIGMAAFYSTTAAYVGPLTYPVEMRASPTITITGGSGDAEATAGYAINHSSSNDWFQTFQSSDSTTKCAFMYISSGVSGGDGDAGRGRCADASNPFGKIEASSEL